MTNEEFIKSVSLPDEEWRDVVGYGWKLKHHRGYQWMLLSEYETLIKSKNSFITTQSDYQQPQPPQLQDPQLLLQFEPQTP